MGDTSSNHVSNSEYSNPAFYYKGTLDPLGTPKLRNHATARQPLTASQALKESYEHRYGGFRK